MEGAHCEQRGSHLHPRQASGHGLRPPAGGRWEELLARTFGEAWERYAARVPAWLPGPSHRSGGVVLAETADANGASVQLGGAAPPGAGLRSR